MDVFFLKNRSLPKEKSNHKVKDKHEDNKCQVYVRDGLKRRLLYHLSVLPFNNRPFLHTPSVMNPTKDLRSIEYEYASIHD